MVYGLNWRVRTSVGVNKCASTDVYKQAELLLTQHVMNEARPACILRSKELDGNVFFFIIKEL